MGARGHGHLDVLADIPTSVRRRRARCRWPTLQAAGRRLHWVSPRAAEHEIGPARRTPARRNGDFSRGSFCGWHDESQLSVRVKQPRSCRFRANRRRRARARAKQHVVTDAARTRSSATARGDRAARSTDSRARRRGGAAHGLDEPLEIVLDLGRAPEARFPGRDIVLSRGRAGRHRSRRVAEYRRVRRGQPRRHPSGPYIAFRRSATARAQSSA